MSQIVRYKGTILLVSSIVTVSIAIVETLFILRELNISIKDLILYSITVYGMLWLEVFAFSLLLSPLIILKQYLLERRAKLPLYLLGICGIVSFCVTYYINATAYRRLYESFHMVLGVISILSCITVSYLIILGEYKKLTFLVTVLIISLFMLIFSTLIVRNNELVREISYNRSVIVAQSLLKILGKRKAKVYLWKLNKGCDVGEKKGSYFGRYKDYNILFVTIDAVRKDILFKSEKYSIMPNLEMLGKIGLYYINAYAPSSSTVLSTYSMLIGKDPSQVKLSKVVFTLDDRLIEVVKSLGWKKTQLLPINDTTSTFVADLKKAGYKSVTCASIPFYRKDGGITKDFDIVDSQVYLKRNYNFTGIVADILPACVIYWWDKFKDDPNPIFFWVHFPDAHAPYWPHNPYSTKYDSEYIRYLGELRFSDNYLGVMLSKIKESTKWNKLLLIVTSDHGEEFGEHGGGYHASSLYEEVVRVPLIIAGPQINHKILNERVSLLDLPSTILYLVGIDSYSKFSGCILPPFGEDKRYYRNIIYSYLDTRDKSYWEMVIFEDWKLIHQISNDTWELYNLKEDPKEKRNIFDLKGDEILKKLERFVGSF